MRIAKNNAVRMTVAFVAAVALAFGMLGLTACSSSEGSSSAPMQGTATEALNVEDIEIFDLGYNQDDEGNVTYAFIAVNPNADYTAHSVMFSIEGYDAQGSMILGSAEEAIELYPNVPTAFSGTSYVIDAATEIETFSVVPSMESVSWTPAEEAATALPDMFEFSNIGNSRAADGAAVVRGVALVNDPEALAQLEGVSTNDIKLNIAVLLADTNGDLVAGGSIDDVAIDAVQTLENEAGETIEIPTASFSVTIPGAPSFKEAVCFASPTH